MFLCFLTSCIGFELQSVSNEGVCGSQLRDRLHFKPFAQVIAQQLVGKVGQNSNEDANPK